MAELSVAGIRAGCNSTGVVAGAVPGVVEMVGAPSSPAESLAEAELVPIVAGLVAALPSIDGACDGSSA